MPLSQPATGGTEAEIILTDANIITLNKNLPKAEALVAAKGKIIFIGSSKDALKYKKSDSRIINLAGKTVIPGLVDAHAHFIGLGEMLSEVNLRETKSFEEVITLVRQRILKTPKGEWIIGRGWDQNDWESKEFPDNQKLDEIANNNPVILKRVDGHAALVNMAALTLAKISRQTKDPDGGKIIKGKDGDPTGVLIDNAINLVTGKIPKKTVAQIKEAILKAQKSCLEVGLTGVHEAGIDEDMYTAYQELGKEGKLKMRIYAMVDLTMGFYEKALKMGPQKDLFDGRFSLRTVKMYADGALGSRGALLSEPYSDDPSNSGLLLTPIEKMKRVAKESTIKGFQVATHAIGDKANKAIIDVYESVSQNLNPKDARFRIEHAQVIQPSDLERMKTLNIIASMQPTHCTSDMDWADERLGSERLKWGYPWKSVIDRGIVLASGSDFPVESNDPLLGIYAAVTRQDINGKPKGGFYPEQRLSVYEAVESFTKGAAYAAFEENRRGEIKVGMDADLTVLSKDIFNIPRAEIPNAKAVMTIVEGEIAYP